MFIHVKSLTVNKPLCACTYLDDADVASSVNLRVLGEFLPQKGNRALILLPLSAVLLLNIGANTRRPRSDADDDSSSEEEIICAEPWTRIHPSCIFNNSTLTSQKESAAMCDSMGGYLLVISNVAERQGVVNELKRLVNTYRSTDYLNWWVGLEFGGEPAQWRWVSDEEFNSKLTDWAPAQPGAQADCAMFDYQGYPLEEDCELQHLFICEQNRTALTTTTAATTSTSTVAPVTSTGEMVTEQEFTSGGPEISTVRTRQPTTQHTTPDVGPNQPTRNHTDEPTELPDVSNQTSGTPRPDSGSGSRNDPNVSTTGQSHKNNPALISKELDCGIFFGIANIWIIQIITWYGDARFYPYVILKATKVVEYDEMRCQ